MTQSFTLLLVQALLAAAAPATRASRAIIPSFQLPGVSAAHAAASSLSSRMWRKGWLAHKWRSPLLMERNPESKTGSVLLLRSAGILSGTSWRKRSRAGGPASTPKSKNVAVFRPIWLRLMRGPGLEQTTLAKMGRKAAQLTD